jgi:hypothetical protein
MSDCWAHIAGELAAWPSKEDMAAILRAAGLTVVVGRYSVRVEDCSSFSFEEFGGDLGDPIIEADADSVEELLRDANLVSEALRQAGIRHRFELYDDSGVLQGYVHHDWPLSEQS